LRLTLLYSGTLLIIFALAIVGIWGARALRRRAELENLRRDFVAGVSHELRTPAASICLLAGNLMDGRVANEDRRQQYYQALNRDAQRLQRLVADVLDASRLERGVFQVDPRFMNPGPLLRDLAEEQAPRLADAGLQLKTEIADELPDTMLDAPSVERAVANLLENARKYAHEGGLVILRAWSDEKGLIIEIEDRGSGVPENLREKIFEAYERGLAGRNNRHPAEGSVGLAAGAGLGLALVRETLIAHGGTAEVLDARNTESSDGSKEESELSLTTGARFRLSFPVCSEE
jgi:signal transduction histidine kinase